MGIFVAIVAFPWLYITTLLHLAIVVYGGGGGGGDVHQQPASDEDGPTRLEPNGAHPPFQAAFY
ncbi:hypothetical protein GQX74_006723 [Glossina fuscipes]|nr:hypothetical protein GQX74_006723 [Glossina fuscipes]